MKVLTWLAEPGDDELKSESTRTPDSEPERQWPQGERGGK
jgi:hypothetical protein